MTNDMQDSGPVTSADDPRVTAYALGELDGEQKLAVETWLAQHPEARDDVTAVAELGDLLAAELASEPAPALDDTRREAVEAALQVPPPATRGGLRFQTVRTWAAAAAVLLVGTMLAVQYTGPSERVPTGGAVAQGEPVGAPPPESGGAFAQGDRRASDAGVPAGEKDSGDTTGAFKDRMAEMGYMGKNSRGVPTSRAGGGPDEGRMKMLRELGYTESSEAVAEAEELIVGGQGGGGSSDRLDAMAEDFESLGYLGGDDAVAGVDSVDSASRSSLGLLDETVDPSAVTLFDEAHSFSAEQVAEADLGALLRFEAGPAGGTDPSVSLGEFQQELLEDAFNKGYAVNAPATANATAPAAPGLAGVEALPSESSAPSVNVIGLGGGTATAKTANNSASPGLLTGRGKARASGARGGAPAQTEPARRSLAELGYVGSRSTPAVDHDSDASRLERDRRAFVTPSTGESYAKIHENPFVRLSSDPGSALSTFGIDVDTASYSNVRRFLHRGQAPDPDAVRLEELINAFRYDDPAPTGADPLALTIEAADSPWSPGHRIVRLGLKGREIPASQRPPTSLVLLLDVSGSMKSDDKLPLLVQSMEMLLDSLRADDRVAIVTYASGSQVVLPSTAASDRDTIVSALRSLHAEGSTHASAGIELAYQVASEAFLEEGNNRVLLATDGDFNVGVTEHGGLHQLITGKAASGIFLTVLGFGTGNLKDDTAELLADKGNGNYAYIDGLDEAHRVLVREVQGTLHTIAKDLKLQVEFNPATVQAWRLLGYENRALAATDFRDDTKDAGEVGAGHSLTVLYEVIPVGAELPGGTADLRYHSPPDPAVITSLTELLTVNMRWLPPTGGEATERALPFEDAGGSFAEASTDLRFSSAVAAFGMALRRSSYRGDIDLLEVADIAAAAKGEDADGRRAEFVTLARNAKGILKD
jgi:Ca-activated chloride channel family protein